MSRASRLWLIATLWVAASAMLSGSCRNGAGNREPSKVAIPMEVGSYHRTTFGANDVGPILDQANYFLNEINSPGDYKCAVKLDARYVGQFEVGDGTVNSAFDFDALFQDRRNNGERAQARLNSPGPSSDVKQVRIVDGIYWCGAQVASAAGCADEWGHRVVAARREGMDAEIWAHEIGHTKGLFHRENELAVMNPQIVPGAWALNWLECQFYKW